MYIDTDKYDEDDNTVSVCKHNWAENTAISQLGFTSFYWHWDKNYWSTIPICFTIKFDACVEQEIDKVEFLLCYM